MDKRVLLGCAILCGALWVSLFKPAQVDAASEFTIKNNELISYSGNEKVVRIPKKVTKINKNCFARNKKIEKVYISKNVTFVDKYAFMDCDNLYMVKVESAATEFANMTFYRSDKLKGLTGPKVSKARKYARYNGLGYSTKTTPSITKSSKTLLVGDSYKPEIMNTNHTYSVTSDLPSVVKVNKSGKVVAISEGKAKLTIKLGSKKFVLNIQSIARTEKNRIDQVINEEITKNMTNYQKAKVLHNWLIRHVKYDYRGYLKGNVKQRMHTSQGALLYGVAVCDGYAQAYEKLLDAVHIKNVTIIGRSGKIGHAWNQVKIRGKWYHVDVTFDDPIVNKKDSNKAPFYQYFLVSDDEISTDHKWMKRLYPKCKESYS